METRQVLCVGFGFIGLIIGAWMAFASALRILGLIWTNQLPGIGAGDVKWIGNRDQYRLVCRYLNRDFWKLGRERFADRAEAC